MLNIRKLKSKIYQYLFVRKSPLESDGERIDIDISKKDIDSLKLDMYQKSHYQRYLFALNVLCPAGVTGDFACGSGYGSVLLAGKSERVIGMDINAYVVEQISRRYDSISNLEFVHGNLLNLTYEALFDSIVSFETVEHFKEEEIPELFNRFSCALKPGGTLIFSTPYLQERSPEAVTMGFHLTFDIDEEKIRNWLGVNGLQLKYVRYQNYVTHVIEEELADKDFIICVAVKE